MKNIIKRGIREIEKKIDIVKNACESHEKSESIDLQRIIGDVVHKECNGMLKKHILI